VLATQLNDFALGLLVCSLMIAVAVEPLS